MPRKKAGQAAEPAQVEAVVTTTPEKPESKKKEKKESLLEKVAPKKTTARKVAEKAPRVEEIYLQMNDGAEWNIADCKARAIAAYVAEGHRESSVKKLVIYLKPEEGKAYYVINDRLNGSVDL